MPGKRKPDDQGSNLGAEAAASSLVAAHSSTPEQPLRITGDILNDKFLLGHIPETPIPGAASRPGVVGNVALAALTALAPKLFKASSTHFFVKHPWKVAAVFGLLNMAVAPDLARAVLDKLMAAFPYPEPANILAVLAEPDYTKYFTAVGVTAAVRFVLTSRSTRSVAKLLDYAQRLAMRLASSLSLSKAELFIGMVVILCLFVYIKHTRTQTTDETAEALQEQQQTHAAIKAGRSRASGLAQELLPGAAPASSRAPAEVKPRREIQIV